MGLFCGVAEDAADDADLFVVVGEVRNCFAGVAAAVAAAGDLLTFAPATATVVALAWVGRFELELGF